MNSFILRNLRPDGSKLLFMVSFLLHQVRLNCRNLILKVSFLLLKVRPDGSKLLLKISFLFLKVPIIPLICSTNLDFDGITHVDIQGIYGLYYVSQINLMVVGNFLLLLSRLVTLFFACSIFELNIEVEGEAIRRHGEGDQV
jgi:hypothetical protein